MNRTIGVALLLGACSGGEPPMLTPQDSITRPPPVVETGDSGEAPGGRIDAAGFLLFGYFAYDESNQRFVTYGHPDLGLIPSSLVVLFVDTSITTDGITPDNSCAVSLELSSPQPNADWVKKEITAWAGFDIPSDAAMVDGCTNHILPPEFNGNVGAEVAKWPWGMGLSPLTDDTRKALENGLPASEWSALQPFAVGASIVNPLFAGALADGDYLETGYTVGFEVDGNFQIVLGGTGNPEPIQKELINTPKGVATGYYEASFGLFSPGNILTMAP